MHFISGVAVVCLLGFTPSIKVGSVPGIYASLGATWARVTEHVGYLLGFGLTGLDEMRRMMDEESVVFITWW